MLIAERIVRDVLREHLEPGDLLPPEHQMLERYEIGRGTLREALRLLEFEGVIALKPGPRGGPVLLDMDATHLASTLILLMQLKHSPFRTIVEARIGIEPMTSRLAAVRISDEATQQLNVTIQLMEENLGDRDIFFESNRQFHDIIAWSSGNPLFGYIVEALLGIADGTVIGIDYPDFRRKAILKAHKEIYAAIVDRDAERSENRMREHLDAYMQYAEKKYMTTLDRVIPWDRALNR